jgi:hypothetical protein
MSSLARAGIFGSITLIIAISTVVSGKAQAPLAFLNFGYGQTSCGQFLRAVEEKNKVRPSNANPITVYTTNYVGYLNYTMGFITGANFEAGQFNNPEDAKIGSGIHDYWAGAVVLLENYCHQQPLEKFVGAVIYLRTTLTAQERR